MIATMIISIVIMSLLQMKANNMHNLFSLKKKVDIIDYSTFLISNHNYGFENQKSNLYSLLNDEFKIDSSLRRKLKNTKVDLLYQQLENIDFSGDINTTTQIGLDIGKTVVKLKNSSISFIRIGLNN